MIPLIVLLWTQEIAPLSFLMPWMISIVYFLFRSTEHDHVEDDLPTKLLRIWASRKMNLEEFKDLISIANYKLCKSKMEKNPT